MTGSGAKRNRQRRFVVVAMALACPMSLAKSIPRATDNRMQVNYSFSCWKFPHKEVRVARSSGTRHCSTFRVLASDGRGPGGDNHPSPPLAGILKRLKGRSIREAELDAGKLPWHRASEILSDNAPDWSGEVRDVRFFGNCRTVIYRVTIRGSNGEAFRESTGTVSCDKGTKDPVAAAEEIAFLRAFARFGLKPIEYIP